jgi:hypothetical protein
MFELMFPKTPPKKPIVFGDFDPVNQRNLKRLENGGEIKFWQMAKVLAIGEGHKPAVMEFAYAGNEGKLKITKGTLTDPGTIEVVQGRVGQTDFKDAIKRVSKKKVVF